MLKDLYIENLAVISRADIALKEGFNVFTGETGAGKTVLIGAINAVLGQRVSKDLIRAGESRAQVAALFTGLSRRALDTLDELGYEPEEDGSLLLSRVIRQDSTECRVGGRPATAAALKALSPLLIDLHGQNDNARLLSPEYHLSLVDRFGRLEGQVQAYGERYRAWRSLRDELDGLEMDEGVKQRRIDLLQYQVEEITQADLSPGEEEELEAQRAIMRNAAKIAEALGTARELLNPEYGENPGIGDQLSSLSDAIAVAAQFIPDLQETAERVTGISYEMADLSRDLTSYLEAVEFSPQELDEMETRLSLIHTLKTKYGPDIPAVLAFRDKARAELEELTGADERRGRLEKQCEKARVKAQELADALSAARSAAGEQFAQAVQKELAYLDMPSVRMTVSRETREPGPSGQDTVELLIAPNPGEPPRPLHKTASGGEISRVMLSIKNVLADSSDAVTSIFDEVDTGVSGRAADKIGLKLAQVSMGRQVLCVTHLAQVAAYADCHLLIQKDTGGGRAFTRVRPLEGGDRAGELARIISGDAVTEAALLNAQEMIFSAEKKKKKARR